MPNIPKDYRNRVAQFLEKQGFKEQALVVSNDDEHKCVHLRAFCCLPSFLCLFPHPQIQTRTRPQLSLQLLVDVWLRSFPLSLSPLVIMT